MGNVQESISNHITTYYENKFKKSYICSSCPECFNIPAFKFLSDNKLEIKCDWNLCNEKTMNLTEYTSKLRKNQFMPHNCKKCEKKKKSIPAKIFCLECHGWICKNCIQDDLHKNSFHHCNLNYQVFNDRKCSICTTSTVWEYCFNCEQYFCTSCYSFHMKGKKREEHYSFKAQKFFNKAQEIRNLLNVIEESIDEYHILYKNCQEKISQELKKIEEDYKMFNRINKQQMLFLSILVDTYNSRIPNPNIVYNLESIKINTKFSPNINSNASVFMQMEELGKLFKSRIIILKNEVDSSNVVNSTYDSNAIKRENKELYKLNNELVSEMKIDNKEFSMNNTTNQNELTNTGIITGSEKKSTWINSNITNKSSREENDWDFQLVKIYKKKINCISIISDNSIAIGYDKAIGIISLKNDEFKEILSQPNAHNDQIRLLLAISENKIASCSNKDSNIKIWQLQNNLITKVREINAHYDTINKMIKLYDLQFASCSNDKSLAIWNSNPSSQSKQYKFYFQKPVKSMVHISQYLVGIINNNFKLVIFDYNKKEIKKTFNNIFLSSINAIAVSNKGDKLFIGESNINVINLDSLQFETKILLPEESGNVQSLIPKEDSLIIVTGLDVIKYNYDNKNLLSSSELSQMTFKDGIKLNDKTLLVISQDQLVYIRLEN